jgi:hypothetical protein
MSSSQCFRPPDWLFGHGFPSINFPHKVIFSHTFNMP